MSSRPSHAWLLLIAAAVAIKLIVLAQLSAHPLLQPRGDLDTTYYVALAERIADGDINLGGQPFFVSPLYAYVLGAIFAVFGTSLIAAQLVQIGGGVLAVCLMAWTARRWFGAAAGWTAGALAIGTGVFTFNEIAILQSSIDPLLTSLWLAALTAALTTSELTAPARTRALEWRMWLLTGALIGLHALNRPNVLICAAALIVIAPIIWRSRIGLTRAAACAAGVAVVVGAVTLRNASSFGEPLLITAHGGLNFFIGNNADADGTYSSVAGITPSIRGQVRDAKRVAEAAEGRALSEREVSGYFYDRAWDWIAAHPADALRLFARKLAYTLNDADLALNYSYAYFSRDEWSLLRVLVVGPWCLVPLGLLGLAPGLRPGPRFADGREHDGKQPRYATTQRVEEVAGHRLRPHALGGGRGGPQVERSPSTWLRAGLSAHHFLPFALMTPSLALGVAVFFVSGRYRLPLLPPLVISSAPVLVRVWRVTRARSVPAASDVTASAGPKSATRSRVVVFMLGVLFVSLAVLVNWRWGLDDGRASARTEMAVIAIEAGDYPRAEQLIALAAEHHPQPGLMHYLIARAWHARGELARAIGAYRRALEYDSQQPEIAFNLGEALIASGSAREAIPHLRLACDRGVRPDRCPALLSAALEQYGLVLMLENRTGEAASAFEQATQLDPSNATAAYNLAVAHLGLDDHAASLRWLDEALRRQPQYEAAQRLRARLGH